MSTKLDTKGAKRTLPVTFTIKEVASEGADTVIEGWANKAVVDRGMDYIGKSAWNLKNFEKNPIILFNHDKDKPIGKALGVQATDEGLYIKARISKSKDPMVSYVRDMIKEGILNAFSVGFDAGEEVKSIDGVNQITKAELYEVSVVSMPMNQDSLFSLTSKDLKVGSYKEAREIVLKALGADCAASVHSGLEEKGIDKEGACEEVAKACDVPVEEVMKALSGEVKPMPENMVKEFEKILGMEPGSLGGSTVLDPASENPPEDAPSENAESDVAEEKKPTEEEKSLELKMDQLGGEDNPYLIQSKQTNILLGMLISEIQKLSASLQGKAIAAPEAPVVEQPVENSLPPPAAEQPAPVDPNLKRIDIVSERLKTLEHKLKILGV
jgi:HK97 family phage prohead protease